MSPIKSLRILSLLFLFSAASSSPPPRVHSVINTWSEVFTTATLQAHSTLMQGSSALDAIESGCSTCESLQCDTSVGFGNHPDTQGFTSLDAMIMDGNTMDVGSVGYIRRMRRAISIARCVMHYTSHTLLVGQGAEDFAQMMGFALDPATTEETTEVFKSWREDHCQPNYYANIEQAQNSCGPYPPPPSHSASRMQGNGGEMGEEKDKERGKVEGFGEKVGKFGKENHDTIGMVAIDAQGNMACGTSTNGAIYKVAGRVGDSPIVGSGCYVDTRVGGAAATGDGDVMMRFSPSFHAVLLMEVGVSPTEACRIAINRIAKYYPGFSGGIVCMNNMGEHGGATHNMEFSYSFINANMTQVQVVNIS